MWHELASASHLDAFSPFALVGLSMLLNPPRERPHKNRGPSTCGAHWGLGSGEPNRGVWGR